MRLHSPQQVIQRLLFVPDHIAYHQFTVQNRVGLMYALILISLSCAKTDMSLTVIERKNIIQYILTQMFFN